jgi:hypothetical protein
MTVISKNHLDTRSKPMGRRLVNAIIDFIIEHVDYLAWLVTEIQGNSGSRIISGLAHKLRQNYEPDFHVKHAETQPAQFRRRSSVPCYRHVIAACKRIFVNEWSDCKRD